MLYPISDTPARSWILPFAASGSPYFTGYAIQNANSMLTVQTDVVVELVGSNGTVLERREIQLSPGTRTANLIAAGHVGYVRITSNFAVHVMGLIGTNDNRVMEQIPGLR